MQFIEAFTAPMVVLPFPDIDPIIVEFGPFEIGSLSIGPLAIRWYALAYIAGLILGWQYLLLLLKNKNLWPANPTYKENNKKDEPEYLTPASRLDIDDLLIWATLGVIVGGRLGYVLFYKPSQFLDNPLSIFAVWQGGMAFHGGLLGVAIATILFCRARNLDPFRIGDLLAAAAPIGLFFGRIANFINGELWGKMSDVPWAMVFPMAGPWPRHPSQLYEAALEGLVLFIIVSIAIYRFRVLDHPGRAMGIFISGYGLFRTFIEFFRQPDEGIDILDRGFGFFTMGMLLSIPMVLIGLALIWRTMPNAPKWLHPDAVIFTANAAKKKPYKS